MPAKRGQAVINFYDVAADRLAQLVREPANSRAMSESGKPSWRSSEMR